MMFLVGCTPVFEAAEYDWVEEVDIPEFFGEELVSPKDMIAFQDGFLVADAAQDALFYVDESETYLLAEVASPLILREHLLASSDRIYELDEEGIPTLLVENRASPRAMLQYKDTIFWLEEDTLFSLEDTEVVVQATELPQPYDMIVWEDAIWMTTQSDRGIWRFTMEEGAAQILTSDNIPHCFSVSDEGLWVSTRSYRWPYGGWIGFFDGASLSLLSESPPQAEKLLPYKSDMNFFRTRGNPGIERSAPREERSRGC